MPLPNLRKLLRRGPQPRVTLEKQRDDLPKTGLFSEPLRVTALTVLEPEVLDDGRHRVTFLVEVRDTEGRRCPDVAIEARVGGPDRRRTVQGTTDLFGRLRFRMAGPAGTYDLEVTDVGAFGLAWDPGAGPRRATTTVG